MNAEIELSEFKKKTPLTPQILIIRQSCLKSATQLLANDKNATKELVLAVADEFEKWVNRE